MFENFCYALLIKRYQLKPKQIENDSQPEELVPEVIETNRSIIYSHPEVLALSSSERLHYREEELVWRYHVPNKFEKPEGYTDHLQPPSYS